MEVQKPNAAKVLSLLKDTTNSYKYLFFFAFFRHLKQSHYESLKEIPLHHLVVEMLAISWYPCTFFKLNFGTQDQISIYLNEIKSTPPFDNFQKYSKSDFKKIREELLNNPPQQIINDLTRYVPYRLLRPLFDSNSHSKLPDAQVNDVIFELAQKNFLCGRIPYKFSDNKKGIIPHPEWVAFIKINEVL